MTCERAKEIIVVVLLACPHNLLVQTGTDLRSSTQTLPREQITPHLPEDSRYVSTGVQFRVTLRVRVVQSCEFPIKLFTPTNHQSILENGVSTTTQMRFK